VSCAPPEPPAALADLLEAHGVKTSQGAATWSKGAVQSVMRSRVYLGELSYGTDRRYVNPESHEPIIDRATWEAAQHPNGRRLGSPRGEGDYLLTGLVRCASCGYSLQATKHSRGWRLYRCNGRHAGGRCPAPARARAELIEPQAEIAFWELVDDRKAEGVRARPDLTELERALSTAERRLAQALTPEIQDAAGDGWAAMIGARRAERDQAARALGCARAELAESSALPSLESLRTLGPTLTTLERRELIAARFDTFALRRTDDGVDLIAFPRGTAPASLSRRGSRRQPGLHPLNRPTDARMAPAQNANKRSI
jgi:hypothetical protein